MNLRRLVFTTSVMLLGLCTAPARAEILYTFTAGSTAALSLPSKSTIPDSSTGILFFAAVATVAGALEVRRRTHLRAESKSN